MKQFLGSSSLFLLLILPVVISLNPNCPNCRVRRHRPHLLGKQEGPETSLLERRPFEEEQSQLASRHRRRKRVHPYRRHRFASPHEEKEEGDDDGYVITAVIIDDKQDEENINYNNEGNDYHHSNSNSEEDLKDFEKTSILTTKIADKFKNVADHFDAWSQNFESTKVSTSKRGMPRGFELECPLVQGTPSCRQYDGHDECSSPGERDSSCPQGICCFNGCSNVCFQSSFLMQKQGFENRDRVHEIRKGKEMVCPKPKPFKECNLYDRSECWSPGVPDLDCPGSVLCCFDGCRNVCVDGRKPDGQRNVERLSGGNAYPEFPNFYSFTSSGGDDSPKSSQLAFAGQPQIHAPKSTIQIYPLSFVPQNNGPPGPIYAVPIDNEEEIHEVAYAPILQGEDHHNDESEETDDVIHMYSSDDSHQGSSPYLINRLSNFNENSDIHTDDYYDSSEEEESDAHEILESPYIPESVKPVENVIRLSKGSQKPVIYITNTFHIPSGVDVSGSQLPEGIQIEDFRKDRRRLGLKDDKRRNEDSDRRIHRYDGVLTPQETMGQSNSQCPPVSSIRSPYCGGSKSGPKCSHPNEYDPDSCEKGQLCCFDGCQYSCILRLPRCKQQVNDCDPNQDSFSLRNSCSNDSHCPERGSICCFDGCRSICESHQEEPSSGREDNEFVSELLSSPDLIKSSLENYFLG